MPKAPKNILQKIQMRGYPREARTQLYMFTDAPGEGLVHRNYTGLGREYIELSPGLTEFGARTIVPVQGPMLPASVEGPRRRVKAAQAEYEKSLAAYRERQKYNRALRLKQLREEEAYLDDAAARLEDEYSRYGSGAYEGIEYDMKEARDNWQKAYDALQEFESAPWREW